jgi:alkylation response protein AidB-like acyl-CoA dehydrogenase
MHMQFSNDDLAFRDEVRAFLAEHLSEEMREARRVTINILGDYASTMQWHKVLHKKGWVAPSWPKEHGGTGWTPTQQYIFASECAAAGAPRLSPLGLDMVAPAIMGFGSEAQKNFYLPRILSGEESWCQGYSEPGAGSDLASLQTRAVSDGDDYIVNGTKIWTTWAHHADRMFCLVRTATEGKPQQGISFILIDMETPGITVKPIHTMAGDHEFNQVFLEDVRVPKANRLGEENEGWTVAKYLLEFERGGSAYGAGLRHGLAAVRRMAERRAGAAGNRLLDDPDFSRRLAEADVALTAVEYTEHRAMADLARTGRPGPASSMLKTRGTETMQQIGELAVQAIGNYALPNQPEARVPGANVRPVNDLDEVPVVARYLNERAGSIYGGSNEIQRNIMAKLVLGM